MDCNTEPSRANQRSLILAAAWIGASAGGSPSTAEAGIDRKCRRGVDSDAT